MTDPETQNEQLRNLGTRAVAVEYCNAPVRKDESRQAALRSITSAALGLTGERTVLADDPQNPRNQVPDFSKGKS